VDPTHEQVGFFEDLVQTLDGIVWEVDLETMNVRFISDRVEAILGYPKSAWIGSTNLWSSILHPEDAWVADHSKEQARLGLAHQLEYRVFAEDGRIVWLRDHVTVVLDGDRPIVLRGVMFDITEQKEAETRSRALLDAMPDMMVRLDSVGTVLDFRANDPKDQLCKAEDVIGLRIHERMPEDIIECCMHVLHRTLASGQMQVFEYNLTLNHQLQHFEARMVCCGTDEVLAVVANITRRRALEQKMRQTQKVEELGLMAGGIAHDFNNLLVGVLGHAGLALRHIPEDSAARGFVKQIEVAARRASDLTHQLLAYAGKSRVVLARVDLAFLVQEMVNVLGSVISRQATIRLDCPEPLRIQGDASQLNQVVMNLLTNASDALLDGVGMIHISCRAIDATQQMLEPYEGELEPGRYALLQVRDSGCGMNEQMQARMFDPFYSTKFTGRGLGLAAVHGIIRGHGGGIRVESAPGEGTTFSLILPCPVEAKVDLAASVVNPSTFSVPRAGCILVVDDEEIVRVFAASTLTENGYKVFSASDGTEALALYKSRADEIDMVLLDMLMPGMDGGQTLEALRGIDPEVRVLLTSGYSETDTISRVQGKTQTQFLQKPYLPDDLASAVLGVLA